MKNLDTINQKKAQLSANLLKAMQDNDETQMATAFTEIAQLVQESVLADAKEFAMSADTAVLNARGVRQLTSSEQNFYKGIISAMKAVDPKQALANLEVAMPETVIDSVFDDIRTNHPLLDAITFVNTSASVKMIVNKTGIQLAAWGPLHSAITKELEGSIGLVDTGLFKLSAFIPVSKDMLDLGPAWIDRYVREILAEATAMATENAVVDGTGKEMPIGMTRSVADDVTVTAGVYPRKQAIVLKEINPITYGDLLSRLAVAPNGKTRVVDEVIFVTNPIDYLKKVSPCTTIRGVDGSYISDVFPHKTKVIQSIGIEEGIAIIGLPKRYFMAVGTGKNAKIEYSDEYQFLEDNRIYLTKMTGNGMPLDDNAFVLVDISDLVPTYNKVEVVAQPEVTVTEVKGVVKTKEQA